MNIDTLRKEDGTFRKANSGVIEKALRAGFDTHLQTGRGIMAFRVREDAEGNPAYYLTFSPVWGKSSDDNVEFSDVVFDHAVRHAYHALNGELHGYEVGDPILYWSNQADRDATVLATGIKENYDCDVLIEYEMPNGTSALVLCEGQADKLVHKRNYSYNTLPKKWVQRIKEQGIDGWIGMPQGSIMPVPFPA